ncbi:MAG: hypothetical protein MUC83_04250 [Pirellula sp.]|nr:hypothetical protein [Pirellula sp.]
MSKSTTTMEGGIIGSESKHSQIFRWIGSSDGRGCFFSGTAESDVDSGLRQPFVGEQHAHAS